MPLYNPLINYVFCAHQTLVCAYLCQIGLLERVSPRTESLMVRMLTLITPGRGRQTVETQAKHVKRLVFHEYQQESKTTLWLSLEQGSCWVR